MPSPVLPSHSFHPLALIVMQLFAVVTAALSLLAPVLAAPSPQLKTVQKSSTGTLVPNSYIVKLKDGTDKDAHLDWLGESHGDAANVTHAQWSSDVLHGYAGRRSVQAHGTCV